MRSNLGDYAQFVERLAHRHGGEYRPEPSGHVEEFDLFCREQLVRVVEGLDRMERTIRLGPSIGPGEWLDYEGRR